MPTAQESTARDKASTGKLTTIDQICAAAIEERPHLEELPSLQYREIAIVEALLCRITYLAHKHEVQRWKDAPGDDADKLHGILDAAREALYHLGANR